MRTILDEYRAPGKCVHGANVKPSSAYAFLDVVRCWLQVPASKNELARLERSCGKGGIFAANGAARFNSHYRQRIELRQPNPDALEWLASREDALTNKVEVALDLVFDKPADAADALEFLAQHLVRRWHGPRQQVFSVKGTRYDASRAAAHQIVLYVEPFSRITGELNVIHLEWRCNSAAAVRSAGISEPGDLLNFPLRKFWEQRLQLIRFDPERLGRYLRNRANGTRSRTAQQVWYRFGNKRVPINADCRRGCVARYSTAQEVLDHHRGRDVRRVAELLPNVALLPDEGPSPLVTTQENWREL